MHMHSYSSITHPIEKWTTPIHRSLFQVSRFEQLLTCFFKVLLFPSISFSWIKTTASQEESRCLGGVAFHKNTICMPQIHVRNIYTQLWIYIFFPSKLHWDKLGNYCSPLPQEEFQNQFPKNNMMNIHMWLCLLCLLLYRGLKWKVTHSSYNIDSSHSIWHNGIQSG